MNLLIIGNGFDLAHGFKTTYSDFLEWAYIANYINQQSPAKTYHMEHDDLVLSFNYSNTFERIYSSKADICYLNGKAESNDEKSHIVFGYDYTPNPNLDGREFLWHYDKAYQRAYKNADNKYKEWMKRDTKFTIHVFGHSLGPEFDRIMAV